MCHLLHVRFRMKLGEVMCLLGNLVQVGEFCTFDQSQPFPPFYSINSKLS